MMRKSHSCVSPASTCSSSPRKILALMRTYQPLAGWRQMTAVMKAVPASGATFTGHALGLGSPQGTLQESSNPYFYLFFIVIVYLSNKRYFSYAHLASPRPTRVWSWPQVTRLVSRGEMPARTAVSTHTLTAMPASAQTWATSGFFLLFFFSGHAAQLVGS